MQVKKFEAPTMQEALDNVKRELGPEAIILQTKTNKKGFGLLSKPSVELTAAISDRSIKKKNYAEKKMPSKLVEKYGASSASKQAEVIDHYTENLIKSQSTQSKEEVHVSSQPRPISTTRYIDIRDDADVEIASLKSELDRVKQVLLESAKNTYETPNLDISPSVTEELMLAGLERRFAIALVKKVVAVLGESAAHEEIMDQIAETLLSEFETVSLLENLKQRLSPEDPLPIIAFTGPTGSGKTTLVAKLTALAFIKNNLKVGLLEVSVDSKKINGSTETIAKILQTPYRVVTSAEELNQSISDFKALDLILIDTPGISHKNLDQIKKLESILSSAQNIRVQLVMPVTMRDMDLAEASKRLSILKPEGLMFTKIDESIQFGAIYNLSERLKLPVVGFSTGQKIPDDYEDATAERFVSLLLGMG